MSESANKARNSNRVLPHKHCKICQEAISAKAEPRVCKKEECIAKNVKNDRSQKQVRIWMFIFFGIFASSFLIRPLSILLN
jgi:predicted nucleic acid-binding Zn ribbon protein